MAVYCSANSKLTVGLFIPQEQIYHLMQNDIYSRFLKSSLYQEMLKAGKEAMAGRGFFSRLQLKKKLDVGLKDASGISPNLPQRYTRRQVRSHDYHVCYRGNGHSKSMLTAVSGESYTCMHCTCAFAIFTSYSKFIHVPSMCTPITSVFFWIQDYTCMYISTAHTIPLVEYLP